MPMNLQQFLQQFLQPLRLLLALRLPVLSLG
jgi:hypothetical protein